MKTNLYNNLQWYPGRSEGSRIKIILELVGANKKILDIGCYDGKIAGLIKNNGNEVYGIDNAQEAVKLANKRGIRAFKLDVETEEIPFSNGEFDAVVAAEIIEHMYDTDAFLEKIKRVLRPGGALVLIEIRLVWILMYIIRVIGRRGFLPKIKLFPQSEV